ncbi:MAG: hypothetical protein HN368_10860 [Spirochaetales bacterium]|nr:hypothetical protein [Spirochaetales bacterium]
MKKMLAPIIIVLIILAYLAFIASLFLFEPSFSEVMVVKIIIIVVVTLTAGALVAVLVQRIKEIRRGEENDLGKY